MRGSVIALLAAVAVNAQEGGINQFYNVTRLISDGDKIRQDTISYVQSLGDDIDRLSDNIFPNGTFDASFGSFDEIQKFVFEQIDNGFNFAIDTINLVADLMERACWTFDTQVTFKESTIVFELNWFSSSNTSSHGPELTSARHLT